MLEPFVSVVAALSPQASLTPSPGPNLAKAKKTAGAPEPLPQPPKLRDQS